MIVEKKRDTSIDVVRGIGIILMIMGHSSFGDVFECYKSSFNMAIFFFFSGYFFKTAPFIDYFKRKFKTIMIPFITFALLTVLVCSISNLFKVENIYTIDLFVKGMVYSNQNIFPITGAIWFLQCLFILEIVFWLLVKYLNRFQLLLSIILLYGIGFLLSLKCIQIPFSIDSVLCASIFFYLGYILKDKKDRITSVKKNILILIIAFSVNVLVIFLNGSVNPRTCELGNPVLYVFNAMLSIILYWNFSSLICDTKIKVIERIKNFVSDIGRNSICYLGLNQLVIKAFLIIIGMLNIPNNSIFKLFRSIICVTITIVIIYFLDKIICKTRLKFFIGK